MKVLITGGAGFIGSHIAEIHLANGDDVVIIDDLSMGSMDNVPAGASFQKMDIRSPELATFIADGRFDVVNHHAAHMELRVSVERPGHDASINVLGSVNVLEACHRAGVRHLVLASSASVLGEFRTIPADESHVTRPISPYGVSKLAMEQYAEYYRVVHGMSISTLRYTNVYGPRQNPNGESGVIAIFLNRFLKGAVATIHGSGDQVRDYVYATDVAKANLLAAQQQLNDTFMVCAGGGASVLEVTDVLQKALNGNGQVEHGPAKDGDPPRTQGSYKKFSSASGWQPTVDLMDGIPLTVASFKSV